MQKVVSNNIEQGVKGEIVKGLHSYQLQWSGNTLDARVAPGNFVKASGTNNDGIWSASGAGVRAGEKIVGVALRHYVSTCASNVETYPQGEIVHYLVKGVVWIETSLPAKIGQSVFIKDADGALVFGDTETLANHTFTGFKVLKSTPDGVTATEPALVAIYK